MSIYSKFARVWGLGWVFEPYDRDCAVSDRGRTRWAVKRGLGLRGEKRSEARRLFLETENVRRVTGYSAAICLTVGISNEL